MGWGYVFNIICSLFTLGNIAGVLRLQWFAKIDIFFIYGTCIVKTDQDKTYVYFTNKLYK